MRPPTRRADLAHRRRDARRVAGDGRRRPPRPRSAGRGPRRVRHPGRQGLPEGRRQPRQPELLRRCDGIHRGNIRRLGGAWVNRIEGGLTTGTNQSTAVAVDGVLYIESALGNVIAVDGATGVTKWSLPADPRHADPPRRRGRPTASSTPTAATTGSSRSTRRPARSSGRSRSRGYGNVEKVAVTYHDGRLLRRHQRRRPRRGARAGRDQRRRALALLGRARARASSATTPGKATPGRTGGATPWMHPAIDPDLGLVYWTFGNARGSRSSQDGSHARRHEPVRQLDRRAGHARPASTSGTSSRSTTTSGTWTTSWRRCWSTCGSAAAMRKLVVYGSKSGMYFILDRTRRHARRWASTSCRCRRSRGRRPGRPSRSRARAAWTETLRRRPAARHRGSGRPEPRRAQLRAGLRSTTAHWDVPILSIPGHGGGADWNHQSFSHSTGLVYTGFGYVAAAHSLTESQQRPAPAGRVPDRRHRRRRPVAPTGCGGRSACRTRWRTATASSPPPATCCSSASPTATCSRWTPATGDELWRFQTGAAISSSPIMLRDRRRAVHRRVRRRHRHPVRQLRAARRLPVGVQDRRQRAAGADAAAAGRPPAGVRRPGRGQRRQQHRRARPHLQRGDRHGRRDRVDRGQRAWRRPTCGCRSARR